MRLEIFFLAAHFAEFGAEFVEDFLERADFDLRNFWLAAAALCAFAGAGSCCAAGVENSGDSSPMPS